MFQKEGSYSGEGLGKNKAKDTAIKKSERRKLRAICLCVLGSGVVSGTDDVVVSGADCGADGGVDGVATTNKSGQNDLDSLLDSIFLDSKAEILLRKIKQPNAKSNAGATLIYLRSPSPTTMTASVAKNKNQQQEQPLSLSSSSHQPQLTIWPYTKKDQPILLQISTSSNNIGTTNINMTIPSLALLSTLPSTLLSRLPTVIVPCQVSKYLCRGANLMRSGILSIQNVDNTNRDDDDNIRNDKRKKKNNPIWVCVQVQNNIQPFAIGLLTNGTSLNNIAGCENNKGVGVDIITCYGDDLYQAQYKSSRDNSASGSGNNSGIVSLIGGDLYDGGNYGNLGFDGGIFVYGLKNAHDKEEEDDDDDDDDEEGDEGREEDDDCCQTEKETNEQEITSVVAQLDTLGIQNSNLNNCNDKEASTTSTSSSSHNEHEQNLFQAFHKSLLLISQKKDLPMPISTYYNQYLLPSRPKDTFLDMKQTKYKKITVFLLEQSKNVMEGGQREQDQQQQHAIITIKASDDKQDPVAYLTGINRSHIDLKEAKRKLKAELQVEAGSSSQDNDPSKKKKKMAIANLYIIPHHVASLLRIDASLVNADNAKSEERKGTGFLTMPECREILSHYVQDNQLIDEYDPENVAIDGPLCDVIYRKSKKQRVAMGKERNEYPEFITRKELNEKWLEKLDNAYAIVSMPGSIIVAMNRGRPPMVTIEVESRQNRKKFITRVRGIEAYAIDASDFATDVSKRFACSATVEDEHSLTSGRPMLRKGRYELVFQGNLVVELQSLLTGNEKLSSHGGVKCSAYCLPKGVFDIILRKGVQKRKK
jgi:translation initiation factor 2D